jgi:hypothetical protein
MSTDRAVRFGHGATGAILGVVGTAVVLGLALAAFVGFRSLTRESPSQRARKEASALFVNSSGDRIASVKSCKQLSVDAPYLTFRCEVATPRCVRGLVFIEEATDFGGHDLQLNDRPDRALTNPCSVRSE